MIDQKIRKDIDAWADERLRLWFTDTVARYEMVGASTDEAVMDASTLSLLMSARLVAISGVDTHDSGAVFMKLVRHMREKLRKDGLRNELPRNSDHKLP